MIDKRIFYCWFGEGEMSELNKKCLESWKKFCPDYEIVKIDESNYDWSNNEYATVAYEHKNWSYLSNAARLEYLKNNNGFYLDTDVQLVKSLDCLRGYDEGFITEFECGQPDSGVLARGSKFPKFYDEVYSRLVPGSILHKEFIQVMYRDYNIHGQSAETFSDNFTILGEEFFPSIRTGLFTKNTVGIHYFENTWRKMWTSVTDDFYPYAKVDVLLGNRLIHHDEGAFVNVTLKTLQHKWNGPQILGKMDYFFNPRVVKISCREFDAERKQYDPLASTTHTITPSGYIITWITD